MANVSVKKINLDYRQAVRRGRPALQGMIEVDATVLSVRITATAMASAAFARVPLCGACLVSPHKAPPK